MQPRLLVRRYGLWLALFFGLATAALAARGAFALAGGERAIDFELPTVDGKTIKLSALRGKVVLVDFWATWCKPCKDELPLLEKLHQKLKNKGLVILAVNINKKKEDATRFASANKLTMPIPLDTASGVVSKYKPPKMPSSYLIDKKGIVRKVNAGFYGAGDIARLEREILDLIAKK